jgi:hypothetical protein
MVATHSPTARQNRRIAPATLRNKAQRTRILAHPFENSKMNSATINELKRELKSLDLARLLELNLRLAKYKKENKELLSYLLFEASNEEGYIATLKTEIDEHFAEISPWNSYQSQKSTRKILRIVQKYIKFSGQKQTEIDLLIHFLKAMKNAHYPYSKHTAMANLMDRIFQKIQKTIAGLHPDLQFDYQAELAALGEN